MSLLKIHIITIIVVGIIFCSILGTIRFIENRGDTNCLYGTCYSSIYERKCDESINRCYIKQKHCSERYQLTFGKCINQDYQHKFFLANVIYLICFVVGIVLIFLIPVTLIFTKRV